MTFDRTEIETGAAVARRALGKDRTDAPAERKLTQEERIRAWSAKWQASESGEPAQTRAAPVMTRMDLHTPGSAYQVGSERYAADGTLWRRTG